MSETEQLSEPLSQQSSEQLSERLSGLIGDIYNAALDRSLWADVLHRAAEFVCAQAGELLARDAMRKDAMRKSANVHGELGVDPHFTPLQPEQYQKLEPTGSTLHIFGTGPVLSTTDVMRCDEYLATPYDNEWAQPRGFVDCMHAILDKWAIGAAQVSLLRHEASGLVDDATYARMRLIVPHLRRARDIGNVIELRRAEAATLVELVDGIGAAIFLVGASGRIVHANASGHAMLVQGSALRAAGGELAPIDADAEQALFEALAMADGGNAAVRVKGIAVPLTARNGDRYVAHVRPLTTGARRRAGASCEAAAAVLVHKPAVEAGTPQAVIAEHYKLSRTELRVLLAIVRHDSVRHDSVKLDPMHEVAEALGIATATLKTHLHRVFTKTGARRKADLVKLVAGYASPLAY